MAKKGQKFKKHVPELKEAILNEYFMLLIRKVHYLCLTMNSIRY